MSDKKYNNGDVVQVITDGSIGIVTSQNPTFVNVLFHNYRCIPIKRTLVKHTGKHIDLGEIWGHVHGEENSISKARESNLSLEIKR